nr:MAG TPA: hypothetical protein [Bacteriophage sp.]
MNKIKLRFRKAKSLKQIKQKPQYDENGLLLNPTQTQLSNMLKEAERDYWLQRKAGRPLRNITCLADLLNEKD